MVYYLNFEKSLSEIEGRIRELNEVRLDDDNSSVSLDEINKLVSSEKYLWTEDSIEPILKEALVVSSVINPDWAIIVDEINNEKKKKYRFFKCFIIQFLELSFLLQ